MPTSGASRIVLDTSAYSHFRGGHQRVLEALARAERVLIPATVLGELEAAFLSGTRAGDNRRALEDFFDEPFVDLLPTTAAVARQYGRVFSTLRRNGTPLPVNDIWIAATAIDCGGTLLTFDRDFDRIAGLDHITLDAV